MRKDKNVLQEIKLIYSYVGVLLFIQQQKSNLYDIFYLNLFSLPMILLSLSLFLFLPFPL